MFDIVKKIGKVFRSKSDKTQSNVSLTKDHTLCSIHIELNYDNEISIRYFWPKFDEVNQEHIGTVANSFGTLLFLINNGLLKVDMVETLSHTIDPNNPFDNQFTESTLMQWLDLLNSTKNDPIVSPSTVFGQYKQ